MMGDDTKVEEIARLPDGSGFAVVSSPLPEGHWLLQEGHCEPPAPWRLGTNHSGRQIHAEQIRAAAMYAMRATSNKGFNEDLDPDALVNNMVIGMLGFNTESGWDSDPLFRKDQEDADLSGQVPPWKDGG